VVPGELTQQFGFGSGYLLTKSRRYSITFGQLRTARAAPRRRGSSNGLSAQRAQLNVTVSSATRSPVQRKVMVPVLPLSQANQSSSTSPEETPRVTVSVSEGGWDA
jgi:hypothetical protein